MAIFVLAHGNDCRSRPERVEPFLSGAAPAAVMSHLQQVDRVSAAPHLAFGWEPGISGKERLEGAVLNQQHQ
jgi:hypothetical protein